MNSEPRHPDRSEMNEAQLLAELHEVDLYLDRYSDAAAGLRGLMAKARARNGPQ